MRARTTLLATAAVLAVTAVGGCGGDDDVADGEMLTIEAVQAPSSTGPDAKRIRGAFAALAASGLDAADQRDRTAVCEQLGCIARIVSDEVSITAWPDASAAAGAAERRVGTLGVTFSSSLVPRRAREAYLRAIRRGSGG